MNKRVMTKHYNEGLSDDEVKKLPLLHFDGKVTLVDDMDTFYRVIDNVGRSGIVGFDTETKPSFRKGRRNTVSLLQLADAGNAWLFRLNKIGLPPELSALLADDSLHIFNHKDRFIRAHHNIRNPVVGHVADSQSIHSR